MFKFASLLLDPAATSQTGFTEGVQTFGEFKNSVSTEGPSPSRSVLPEGFDSNAEISFDENAPVQEPSPAPEQTDTETPAPAPAPAPKPDKKSSDPKFELEEEQSEPEPEPEPEPPKQKKQQAPLPQQQPTQQQKLSRNYEGLPPEVVELLKELHNTPYSKYRELLPKWFEGYNRSTELEEKLKTAQSPNVQWWYDNPNAYLLTEEYTKAAQEAETVQFEATHYQRQLQAVKEGQPWREIRGYDKDGSPVYTVHQARDDGRIDTQAEAYLTSALATLGSMQQQAQYKLNTVQQQFAQKAQQSGAILQEIEDKVFATMKDMSKLSEEDRKYYNMIFQLYPDYMQKHPAVRHTAKAYVAYNMLMRKYSEAATKLKTAEAQLEKMRGKRNFSKAIPTKQVLDEEEVERDLNKQEVDLAKLNEEFA